MDTAAREAILASAFRHAKVLKPKSLVSVCLALIDGKGPKPLQQLIDQLDDGWFDYAVASIYTLMMPADRRKKLGAYFTPPHLVAHLISRMEAAGLDLLSHKMHDPAAGGAAFIVPIVDAVVERHLKLGKPAKLILRDLRARLSGMELDQGLARIANALLRRALVTRHGISCPIGFELVAIGDSLRVHQKPKHSVVGNPPYAKVGAEGQKRWATKFPDILGGQLNLYAMFLRQSIEQVQPGGLVGFIVPTSFIGGPEFQRLRKALAARADILCLDLVEKRSGLFLDVIQDACFIVLRRHEAHRGQDVCQAPVMCGLLHADGSIEEMGSFLPASDGAPWILPSLNDAGTGGHVLEDYGYRVQVGYLVINRQRERLHDHHRRGLLPLIEARTVGLDGSFPGGKHAMRWVSPSPKGGGLIASACVAVQRTSNRKQKRRIHAAPIPDSFVRRHGGMIGENHVIFVIPSLTPKVSPEVMSRLLNSAPVNDKYGRMCGTVSLSAKLLAMLDLPAPEHALRLVSCAEGCVDSVVADAYARSSENSQPQ